MVGNGGGKGEGEKGSGGSRMSLEGDERRRQRRGKRSGRNLKGPGAQGAGSLEGQRPPDLVSKSKGSGIRQFWV